MNFEQSLAYLYTANQLGIRPGLERMRELMKRLGNPQEDYEIVHIAGTNGKGSVSSYCAHVAGESDRKTGWFTSPYLENFNERIRIINGLRGLEDFERDFRSPEISEESFAQLMTEVREQIEDMQADGFVMPTVFEITTACALLHYSREKVDLAVLEVGLGGRLDSTNIIARSLVSVITSLGYDHMDRLGNTLPQIAQEKAGIIKPGCPVILYDPRDVLATTGEGEAAKTVIEDIARERGSALKVMSQSLLHNPQSLRDKQTFIYDDKMWEIRVRGEYQRLNALLAIEACRYFAADDVIARGLKRMRWPGRLEVLQENPLILIDGAHNVQGAAALATELNRDFSDEDIIYVCGILGDKEHEKMLSLVLRGENKRPYAVYCTEAPVPRALPAQNLAEEISDLLRLPKESMRDLELGNHEPCDDLCIYYHADMEKTINAALEQVNKENKALVVFGSLYLTGNLRPLIRKTLQKKD